MRWLLGIAMLSVCAVACTTEDVHGRVPSPDGGDDAGDGGLVWPSCITTLYLCWDIAGECVECERAIDGDSVAGICWANGAMQHAARDGDGTIAVSSRGAFCFRERPRSTPCETGDCTYVFEGMDGSYVLREFRDAGSSAVVLQATCPSGPDPTPIALDDFLAPLADQERVLDACTVALTRGHHE